MPDTTVTVTAGMPTTVTVTGGVADVTVDVQRGIPGATGSPGATGATGATGSPGPNTITTATTTPLVGFLSGNGATVTADTSATFVSGSSANFDSGSSVIFDGGSSIVFFSSSIVDFYPTSLLNLSNGTIKLSGTSFDSSLNFVDPTSAKTITLPDATGTVALTNDPRFTDARTPTAHTHGNISNVGAIGSTASLPLITTTAGVITTGTFGTTAGTFTQGNDSRLSDARTPLAHTHSVSDIVSITSHRLIGRREGNAGAGQEVQVGDGLEFQGSGIRRSALTGDITAAAGSNSTTIANDAVTNAKLANVATATIKGRTTAGTGDPEDLTLGTGIEFSGSTIQRSALTGDITASAGSNTTTLAGTIAGNKEFSGQLQLTGQAATNANSAMTRGLGDARHGAIGLAGLSAISINNQTTPQTIRSASLAVGLHHVRMVFSLNGTANTGTRHGYNFSGTGTLRFLRSRASAAPYVQVLTNSFDIGLAEAATSSQIEGIINVTDSGTFSMQAAQNTSHADTLSVVASSFMIITPCPNGSIS